MPSAQGGSQGSVARVAALMFGSGLCALVYQTVWFRELRLVFGNSTASNAAVLAVFMGGLGLGGALLGARADRSVRPLAWYGRLEVAIAVGAAASPFLLDLVRALYTRTGGITVLGETAATVVHLLLATVVMAVPTTLMGATLPAAARSVQTGADAGRGAVAWLYGLNTTGAVTGTLLSTFALLETLGNRTTLWAAAVLNAGIGVLATLMGSRAAPAEATGGHETGQDADTGAVQSRGQTRLALAAAAVVGLVFLLMELTWYRMLAPILGGSVFTFGLILAVALAGIAGGGALYAVRARRGGVGFAEFGLTCALEGLLTVVPLVAGDDLALLAGTLRAWSVWGLGGLAAGWAVICALVVLPAALVSGYQFPLLIALVGRGARDVGRQVGLAYAFNTAGSMAGSLLGGFVLMPVLGAAGCWRACTAALGALGLAAGALDGGGRRGVRLAGAGCALLALVLTTSEGPTAFWRHGGIGAGRMDVGAIRTRQAYEEMRRNTAAQMMWEADGRESSIAQGRRSGVSLFINGKADGNARHDAPTQVLAGLLGVVMMPSIKSALVVGMGTGSTAGWLGKIPGVRVDAVELEERVLDVVRACKDVNHDVMNNPAVHVVVGDAREILITTPRTYDLINSEPSNPYRAGVASLWTEEYYRAVRARLNPGGLFTQWLQAYEIDVPTAETIFDTLGTVFPYVEVWRTLPADLLIIASDAPIKRDIAGMRERLRQEPLASAFRVTLRATEPEHVLAQFVAGHGVVMEMVKSRTGAMNTDDHNLVEFGFARTVGGAAEFSAGRLHAAARARGQDRAPITGDVDWDAVERSRAMMYAATAWTAFAGEPPGEEPPFVRVARRFLRADGAGMLAALDAYQPAHPTPTERTARAFALALLGRAEAAAAIDGVADIEPVEAQLLRGVWREAEGSNADAAEELARGFEGLRADPWPNPVIVDAALAAARRVLDEDVAAARRLAIALAEPFAALVRDEARVNAALAAATRADNAELVMRQLLGAEPNPPWTHEWLSVRAHWYAATGSTLSDVARDDLRSVEAYRPRPVAGVEVP